MLVYYDSLSLSISFSTQLKTCHQARQTYEINPLESCESVSVRTSHFKAIVSSDSRHALARLTISRRLDTRYTNTTVVVYATSFGVRDRYKVNRSMGSSRRILHYIRTYPYLLTINLIYVEVGQSPSSKVSVRFFITSSEYNVFHKHAALIKGFLYCFVTTITDRI